MQDKIPQALEALDGELVDLFQRWTNFANVSNFVWAQMFCCLGAGATLNMLREELQTGLNPFGTFVCLWGFALYVQAIQKLRQTERRLRGRLARNPLRAFRWYGCMRLIFSIVAIGFSGHYFLKHLNDWSSFYLMLYLSLFLFPMLAAYFAAGSTPPPKRQYAKVPRTVSAR